MTKQKDDHTPIPPGGRAAERLREFERSRGLEPEQLKKGTKPAPDDSGHSADDSTPNLTTSPKPRKK
jgi:hypothetical protein